MLSVLPVESQVSPVYLRKEVLKDQNIVMVYNCCPSYVTNMHMSHCFWSRQKQIHKHIIIYQLLYVLHLTHGAFVGWIECIVYNIYLK